MAGRAPPAQAGFRIGIKTRASNTALIRYPIGHLKANEPMPQPITIFLFSPKITATTLTGQANRPSQAKGADALDHDIAYTQELSQVEMDAFV